MFPRKITILGCGYVGTAVGIELLKRKRQVRATTTTPSRVAELAALGFEAAEWHVDDVQGLSRLIHDQDGVILCVAPGKRTQDYREVFLRGVQSVVAALPGSGVSRIVYTSSTRVYGQDAGEWVDESSATVPHDENGKVLRAAECALLEGVKDLAASEKREVSATVLRLSGIYGPGRDPAERVLKLAGQTRDDGDEWVNLIHRDDIVTAIARLLKVPYHGILNLSDDRPTTRREYYDRLLAEAGLAAIRWSHASDGGRRGKRVDNRTIKRLLDWRPEHPGH